MVSELVASGIFFIIAIIIGLERGITRKEKIKNLIVGFIISIFLGFSLMGIIKASYNKDFNTYNNGICISCGGKYHFVQRYKSYYYYNCDECGKTIKLLYANFD